MAILTIMNVHKNDIKFKNMTNLNGFYIMTSTSYTYNEKHLN